MKLRIISVLVAGFVFLSGPFLFPFQSFAQSAPIVFVAQVPVPADFATILSTFGNHRASLQESARGSDLFIRYPDGSLKNLTAAAGFGNEGQQGATSISVRDPSVHWDGGKILFSMVVGAPTKQFETKTFFWQLYELSGLGANEVPSIAKVPRQPENFNNVMPVYGSDDSIIFSSDRPRNGEQHLYPQLDEYESTPTNSGLWKLDPRTGELTLLDHAPSGAFHPIVDSFGRVIYTRWDHLQRDQQAGGSTEFGAFNFESESAAARRLNTQEEIFPEPRGEGERISESLNLHLFNQFFPWQINQDGTGHETINHIGRHELHAYLGRTFNDDPNLVEFFDPSSRVNHNAILNFFQIREDPLHAGRFFGIDAPEFKTHSAGQIVALNAPPGRSADGLTVEYITDRTTANPSNVRPVGHSGLYRNPLPLSDGTLIAAHTSEFTEEANLGSRAQPLSKYDFRLKRIVKSGDTFTAAETITPGIRKRVSYWDPDELVSYDGLLWEIQPVEVRQISRPPLNQHNLPAPELAVFQELGIAPLELVQFLRERNLALIVSRNVTTRDKADLQQPFNLQVPGGAATVSQPGRIYSVKDLQIVQGDQVRGYSRKKFQQPGRRILAQPLSDGLIPENIGGPQGSVRIEADGSAAAFVPAQRALSWQLTGVRGEGVVRERYWLTFQPGELRVCTSCHGLNTVDQAGNGEPQNPPLALKNLLRFWKGLPPESGASPNSARISLSSRDKKGRTLRNKLVSGGSASLLLRLTDLPTNLKRSLTIKVVGASCKTSSRNLSKASSQSVNFTVPYNIGSGKIIFTLKSGSKKIAALSIKITAGKQTLNNVNAEKLCSAVLRVTRKVI